ncbi:Calponin homology (CH) domain containing protein [Aureococcus anophagefferens]|nr:Calponin homology (CH) domain containing protein [Aureococcus anophagefferens]
MPPVLDSGALGAEARPSPSPASSRPARAGFLLVGGKKKWCVLDGDDPRRRAGRRRRRRGRRRRRALFASKVELERPKNKGKRVDVFRVKHGDEAFVVRVAPPEAKAKDDDDKAEDAVPLQDWPGPEEVTLNLDDELGVVVREVDGGRLVVAAVARSQAQTLVRPGWEIVECDGAEVRGRDDLEDALRDALPAGRATVGFERAPDRGDADLDFSYDCFDLDDLVCGAAHEPPPPPPPVGAELSGASGRVAATLAGLKGAAAPDGMIGGYTRSELTKTKLRTPKVSVRKLAQYVRWIDASGVWPNPLTVDRVHGELRNGLLLCRLMQRLVPGTTYSRLHHKPRSKAVCIANIEQALGIYDCCEKKPDRANVLLREIFDVYVFRELKRKGARAGVLDAVYERFRDCQCAVPQDLEAVDLALHSRARARSLLGDDLGPSPPTSPASPRPAAPCRDEIALPRVLEGNHDAHFFSDAFAHVERGADFEARSDDSTYRGRRADDLRALDAAAGDLERRLRDEADELDKAEAGLVAGPVRVRPDDFGSPAKRRERRRERLANEKAVRAQESGWVATGSKWETHNLLIRKAMNRVPDGDEPPAKEKTEAPKDREDVMWDFFRHRLRERQDAYFKKRDAEVQRGLEELRREHDAAPPAPVLETLDDDDPQRLVLQVQQSIRNEELRLFALEEERTLVALDLRELRAYAADDESGSPPSPGATRTAATSSAAILDESRPSRRAATRVFKLALKPMNPRAVKNSGGLRTICFRCDDAADARKYHAALAALASAI